MTSDLKIEKMSRELIEGKLLSALSEGDVAAILVDKNDLDFLIRAVEVYGGENRHGKDFLYDLKQLKASVFGKK